MDDTTTEAKRRSVRILVSKLSSVSELTRTEALSEIRQLTKLDPETRPIIAESEAIPFIAETLYSSSHPSQDNASATLLNLSISAKEPVIYTRGVLDAIAHVISHHNSTSSAAAVQSAAATIHSLLSGENSDHLRASVGAKRDIVYALVDIIRTRQHHPPRTIKDALKALFAIALHAPNRPTIVQFGAVAPLFALVVKDGRVGIVEDATAVIAQVAGCEESGQEFRKVSGIGILADLLDLATGASVRTRENSVSGMLNLVKWGGERVVEEVREVVEGVAVEGFFDVVENGSAKGKSKAKELLKSLHLDGGYGYSDGSDVSSGGSSRFDSMLSRSSS